MFAFSMKPLREKYKADRWTFALLSKATGLSAAGLCDMFNGKYAPRADNLMLICTALKVHPRRLFTTRKEAAE